MTFRGIRFGRRAAGCVLVCSAAAVQPAHAVDAQNASPHIVWDAYAVPHIYGPDIPTVVRGLGYATMENHAELLLRKIARARGRLAEYFGPKGLRTGEDYVASDLTVIRYGFRDVANDWVARGGERQLALLQAYCAGVNDYAGRHQKELAADLRQILPMTPSDVTAIGAYSIYYQFQAGQNFVPALVSNWQAGGVSALKSAAALPKAGSNAIVIGPQKSADGNAIIVANSHLPWGVNQPDIGSDAYNAATEWLEANLIVGDPRRPALNASGAGWIGLPFLIEGFNDYAGWTHTANNIYNADLFELKLDPSGGNYLFGGRYRPLMHGLATLKVLQPDHSTKSIAVDTYRSMHGPIVAFDKSGAKALALRMAGIDQPSAVTQYWRMLEAKDQSAFKKALSALQVPLFNVFFADRAGEIYYVFGGRQPLRNCAFGLTYFSGVLVPPIEDGGNPACLWTRTFTLDQLPQASHPAGGYFANGNEAPWYASFPQPASLDSSNFPAYLTADGVDFRPQTLHLWLNQANKLTADQVLAGKNSTHLTLADRVLPDLLALANKAAAGGDAVAGKAAAILSAWDRTADEGSVGSFLFELWWDEVVGDVGAGIISADQGLAYSNNVHPKFTVPFDPTQPLTTPSGLDPSNGAQLLADLDKAYAYAEANFGAVGGASAAWGAVHKAALATRLGAQQQIVRTPLIVNDPVSGAGDAFGGIRVVDPDPYPPLGEIGSNGGESYVHVVEFTPQGAVGGSLLVYGNASRPNSPHIGDQAGLFRSKMLKPELRTLEAVTAAAVSVENY